MTPEHCIHQEHGLCARCTEAWEEDPMAYLEFGDHPAGVRRWEE